jgi:hypothetical protein
LKGIDTEIAKGEKAVAGKAAVKRNRFVQLTGAKKAINRELEAKARALVGLKGYVTNLPEPTPQFVLGAYHQLWQIEKSFRMCKSDLGPADLPPQAGLDRSSPHHRDGRARRQPLARTGDRLVNQEHRADPTALPAASPSRPAATSCAPAHPLDQARAIITAVNNAADAH